MRATEITPSKLVIFDIDDTLVHTPTLVHVLDQSGNIVNSLDSHKFTHYQLKPGEAFDFGEFRNAREFFEKSKPIIPMVDRLKQDIATGNKVVMVTARADFDNRELFLDTFRKMGVDMSRVHVYRAGNMPGNATEEKKKIIIRGLLDQGNYSKVIMYDDAEPNLNSFISLKTEYPDIKFYAWHVSPAGKASEYQRSNESQANLNIKENLRDWFKDKWVRFGPDGKIRGDCARGSESDGKPKCLPRSKAHALGKKGRASAAARKRRKDPDANRSGPAINVSTKGTKK